MTEQIPHAVGSVVTDSKADGRWIVAEQSYENCGTQPASYSLRGHPELGTTPGTRAWSAHSELELVSGPDPESWRLLKDAVRLDALSRTVRR